MTKLARFSAPATVASPLATLGNKSVFIRAAMSGFAKSRKCNPEFILTNPELNARQKEVAAKISLKADPKFLQLHRKIADKVVTDRPRGERFSRYIAAALVWAGASSLSN